MRTDGGGIDEAIPLLRDALQGAQHAGHKALNACCLAIAEASPGQRVGGSASGKPSDWAPVTIFFSAPQEQ